MSYQACFRRCWAGRVYRLQNTKLVGISSGVSVQRFLPISERRWRVYSLTIGPCSSQLAWRCEVLTGQKREPSWCLAAIAVFFASIYQAENGTALLIHRRQIFS